MKSCWHNIMLVEAYVKMSVVKAFASFLAGRRSDVVDPNFPFVGNSYLTGIMEGLPVICLQPARGVELYIKDKIRGKVSTPRTHTLSFRVFFPPIGALRTIVRSTSFQKVTPNGSSRRPL